MSSAWSDRKTYIASGLNTLPMVFGIASGVELGLGRWWPFVGFAAVAVAFEYAASVVWMLAYKGMAKDALQSPVGGN